MTNKTMPERIYVWKTGDRQEWSDASETDADLDDTEYVRADIAAGDSNEPLADGQYRWIKEKNDDFWQPALVSWYGVGGECGFDGYEFYVMTEDYGPIDYDDVIAIGPVIRPPEEKC